MKLGLLVDGIELVNATKLYAFHTENKVLELLANMMRVIVYG